LRGLGALVAGAALVRRTGRRVGEGPVLPLRRQQPRQPRRPARLPGGRRTERPPADPGAVVGGRVRGAGGPDRGLRRHAPAPRRPEGGRAPGGTGPATDVAPPAVLAGTLVRDVEAAAGGYHVSHDRPGPDPPSLG